MQLLLTFSNHKNRPRLAEGHRDEAQCHIAQHHAEAEHHRQPRDLAELLRRLDGLRRHDAGGGGSWGGGVAPAPFAEHASMWHSVRNTGLRKPYVLRSHLFRISSPVLDAYLHSR